MLCKDCDYYHAFSKDHLSGLDVSICEFADMLFLDNVENLDMEYPCQKIDFNEYLQKKSGCNCSAATIKKYMQPELFRELKKSGVCMLKFPDGIIEKCFHRQLEDRNSSENMAKSSAKREKVRSFNP